MKYWQQHSLLNLSADMYGNADHGSHDGPGADPGHLGSGTIVRLEQDTIWVRWAGDKAQPNVGQAVEVRLTDKDRPCGTFRSKITVQRWDDDGSPLVGLAHPQDMQGGDQRRQPRAELMLPAHFFHMATKGVLLPFRERRIKHPAVIRDLSETGAQILANDELPQEARIIMTFTFRSAKFEETCDVVWSRVVGERYLFGLHFNQLNLALQDILRTQPLPRR